MPTKEETIMTTTATAKMESAGDSSDLENCSSSGSGGDDDTKKICVDCGTSKTPLWRGGPSGPKSLCNACGIKSRKKRQAALGIRQEDNNNNNKIKNKTSKHLSLDNKQDIKNKIKKRDSESYKSKSSSSKKSAKRVFRFLDLGFKVPAMKRSTVEKKRLWRKLGEEERAAVLLMTLSCG
ncbi:unnamed protein product [Cochlearia groenlandica]